MEQYRNGDYIPELEPTVPGENAYREHAATRADKIAATKEKASRQATALKERVSETARNYGSQVQEQVDIARGRASISLRGTSRRMHKLADYLDAHDARDMSESAIRGSQELVRRHPGKLLLTGLIAGILLGKMLSSGNGRRH